MPIANTTLQVVLADNSSHPDDFVRRMLILNGHRVLSQLGELDTLPATLSDHEPDVVMLTGDLSQDRFTRMIEKIKRTRPGTGVVAIGESIDGEQLSRALNSGADDVLTRPLSEERLLKALRRAAA